MLVVGEQQQQRSNRRRRRFVLRTSIRRVLQAPIKSRVLCGGTPLGD
jgi:hypothetical protein